jgi:hypothetical protein
MQENNAEPRVGRDVLVAHEAAALARCRRWILSRRSVLHDGDNVVIQWVFLMRTGPDCGSRS